MNGVSALGFWTTSLLAIGLVVAAIAVYSLLDMFLKHWCFSVPCGVKYIIMSLRLLAYTLLYTGLGGIAGYGIARAMKAVPDLRYSVIAALASCIFICFRRIMYEQDNWYFFAKVNRPGTASSTQESTENEKNIPRYFGMNLSISWNKFLDVFEARAMTRVREELVEKGNDYAEDLLAALDEKAPKILVQEFLDAHINGNADYSADRISEITNMLQKRITEAGLDNLQRVHFVMGNIRYLGYYDFIRRRKINKIIERHRPKDQQPIG